MCNCLVKLDPTLSHDYDCGASHCCTTARSHFMHVQWRTNVEFLCLCLTVDLLLKGQCQINHATHSIEFGAQKLASPVGADTVAHIALACTWSAHPIHVSDLNDTSTNKRHNPNPVSWNHSTRSSASFVSCPSSHLQLAAHLCFFGPSFASSFVSCVCLCSSFPKQP